MKRIKYLVPLIVAVIVLLLCGTIAGDRFIQETKRKQIYEDAVTVLEQLEDEEVDSNEITDSAAWGPALTTYNKILFAEGNYVPSEDYKLKNRFV